jgi:hypothetical protein
MAFNPAPRSMQRMDRMVEKDLRKGEELVAALPVWIGGTYIPFLGSIIVAVALAASMASALAANSLIITALGAAIGAVVGRYVAQHAARDHPVDAQALQVMLGVTPSRVLIYEPRSLGKPGRLLDSFSIDQVGDLTLDKGNFIRPTRLSFLAPRGLHTYEFSGLWHVADVVAALGG